MVVVSIATGRLSFWGGEVQAQQEAGPGLRENLSSQTHTIEHHRRTQSIAILSEL
jgi:hypothetical protein